MKQLLFLSFFVFIFSAAVAQPSDAEIKKEMTNQYTLDVKFTKSTGTRQWNSGSGNWEYVRGVHIRMKSKDYPGLVVKVIGDAVYQYVGGTKYVYQKFRTAINEWEGIPSPTQADIDKMISADWKLFYGYYFNKIVNLHEGPSIVTEKNFTWSSPINVNFFLKIKADMLGPNYTLETVEQVYDVRLFRDNYKDPWKNFNASSGSNGRKLISTQQLTEAKYKQMELNTLSYTLAEDIARKEAASLPQVEVPDFRTAKELADFFHEILMNGNPQLLKAAMLKTLAPQMMVDGSKTQFSIQGKEMYERAAKLAYEGDMKYKDQYCTYYNTTSLTSKSTIYIQSCIQGSITVIGTLKANDGYIDGVPQEKLKLYRFDLAVRQDQDAINFINSFSDRKKLCPKD